MPSPSCPKCGNTSFEMTEIRIEKANWRHTAIICSHCGAVVGTEELMSIMHMLDKIGKKLGVSFGS